MTDKQRTIEFFKSLGIELDDYCHVPDDAEDGILFLKSCGKSDNVGGYPGFFVDFHFDNNGKFIQCGIWE